MNMAMSELIQRLLKIELTRIGFPGAEYDPVRNVIVVCPDDNRMPTISEVGLFHYGAEHCQFVKEKLYPIMDRVKEIARALEENPALLNREIFILSSCNEWKEYASMRFIAATTDRDTLAVLVANEIMERNMGYGGETGSAGFAAFKADCQVNEVNYDKLGYGFIHTVANAVFSEPETMPKNCEQALRLLEQDDNATTMDSLNLENRSLTFSIVQLNAGYEYLEYYAAGIPDKYGIEDTAGFQTYTETLDGDTDISVSVRSFSVGTGESDHPGEDELEFIRVHMDELDKKYGVDCIQSDSFSHYYEPEEEY